MLPFMKPIFYFVFILFLSEGSFAQSKIKKAEESLKNTTEVSSETEKNETHYDNDDSASNGNFFADVFGELIIQLFAYTVYGIAIESPFEASNRASYAFISKYPYDHSQQGQYTYEWNKDTPIIRSTFSAKYISENSRINGTHLNIDTRFLKRFGFEANYLQLWENNPIFGTDNLAIYTALVKYHRVRTEKFNLWWGLGTTYVDGSVNNFGFSYGLGAELFFAKPLSVETVFNQTFINGENVNRFDGLLNYHLKNYKLTGGYEHLRIGNQNFSTLVLGIGRFL
jgi:hypothetical protein